MICGVCAGLLTHRCAAIAEGHGDVAITLLKAGAESDKRDVDDKLAIDLAPDKKVRAALFASRAMAYSSGARVHHPEC